MLEYFAYKRFKKHKAQKELEAATAPSPSQEGKEVPVLEADDEAFLGNLLADEGPSPALPPRVKTPQLSFDSDDGSSRLGKKTTTAEKTKDKKSNRISLLFRKPSTASNSTALAPPSNSDVDIDREKNDLAAVLEDLNLSAKNNRAFSLSADSTKLVREFNLVLRDIIEGVPTAYDDLTRLLEDKDGVLNKNFDRLPKSMKKLVVQLPDKITGSLAPELLAAAAEAQGLGKGEGGIKEGVKKFLVPSNLQELITKPGAIVTMLRAIVNALKLRWPAFIGTNVIWSVAVFLLLFVLWYCHKRGREVRLDRERTVDGKDRIEELPDDPALPAPRTPTIVEPEPEVGRSKSKKKKKERA